VCRDSTYLSHMVTIDLSLSQFTVNKKNPIPACLKRKQPALVKYLFSPGEQPEVSYALVCRLVTGWFSDIIRRNHCCERASPACLS